MNITVKILNERETHRTMENAIARTFDVRCAIVLTSFFTISNNSSRKKSTRFPSENLFQFNPSLFFCCSLSSSIWPASQYCVSMASFPFLQTITFGIELIAHVLKIEHAIEADANHDQV